MYVEEVFFIFGQIANVYDLAVVVMVLLRGNVEKFYSVTMLTSSNSRVGEKGNS